jgi:hypothetical protein
LTTSSVGAFQTDWLALMLALMLLVTAALRLLAVLLQTADAAGRLEQASRTTIAVVRVLALPGRSLQALSARGAPWSGVLHPFALALGLCSAGLAWLMSSVPTLAESSGRAAWVLVVGAVGFAASTGVLSLWPPSPAGMRQLRNTRDRVAGQLTARVRSSSPTARARLEALRAAVLARIDDEIVPPFAQVLQRDAGVRSEMVAYQRSATEPNEDVLARLRVMHEQYANGTRVCQQAALDAEARLFALLQECDDVGLEQALGAWLDADLGQLAEAVQHVVTVPLGSAAPPQSTAAAAGPVNQSEVSLEPQPASFADMTRRALRALNKPATLAKSELIPLLPRSLHEVWQHSGEVGSGDPSPLEQSQVLRTILVRAIEQLNVSEAGNTRAHQYEALRMQYVMGLSVVQVAMRLGIAEQGVYRRSAEGVEAVANDLWRREQLLAGRGA